MKRTNKYTIHKQVVRGTICDTVEYFGRVETECGEYWERSKPFPTYAAAEKWCKEKIANRK